MGLSVELRSGHQPGAYILRWLLDIWKICVPLIIIIPSYDTRNDFANQ